MGQFQFVEKPRAVEKDEAAKESLQSQSESDTERARIIRELEEESERERLEMVAAITDHIMGSEDPDAEMKKVDKLLKQMEEEEKVTPPTKLERIRRWLDNDATEEEVVVACIELYVSFEYNEAFGYPSEEKLSSVQKSLAKWMKSPNTKKRRNKFLGAIAALKTKEPSDTVRNMKWALKYFHYFGSAKELRFLIDELDKEGFEGVISRLMAELMISWTDGSHGVDSKFYVLQQRLVQSYFQRHLFAKDNFYRSVCLRIYRNMMTSHSRNRMKEMENFNKIKQEIVRIARYVKDHSGSEDLIPDIYNKANFTVTCSRCSLIETSNDCFQKCGRCKMAYYCSKKCFKKDWKRHKKVCIPVNESD